MITTVDTLIIPRVFWEHTNWRRTILKIYLITWVHILGCEDARTWKASLSLAFVIVSVATILEHANTAVHICRTHVACCSPLIHEHSNCSELSHAWPGIKTKTWQLLRNHYSPQAGRVGGIIKIPCVCFFAGWRHFVYLVYAWGHYLKK